MASRSLDRRRSNGSRERSAYSRLKKQNKEATKSEFVEVPRDLKGHVIGKDGYFVKEIMRKSGAMISTRRDEKGFTISGDVEQRAYAKSLILEKVQEILSRENNVPPPGELVQIPAIYKGLVMGKGGDHLRNISTQTGAKVIRKDGEVWITSGTKQQRQHARVFIGTVIAGARLRGLENEFNKVCHFIDGWNLPKDCELKLEKVQDRIVVPGSYAQYRLKPTEAYELQEFCSSSHESNYDNYQLQIKNNALEALRKIKHERVTDEYPKADMWCHFGAALIRGPDEDEADEGEWSIDEAKEKFQPSEEGYWKVGFNEGVILEEINLEGNSCEKTPEDFIARYDLSYLTPCAHRIRCKVWVTKKDVDKRLEDIPIPFSDVKNILEEIHFEDGITRSRCRGWLVLPSRKYLQADILFPGCEFDCRFTIRGRTDSAVLADYAPEEEARHYLSRYLSGLTFTDEDDFGLRLPEKDIPEGFHLIHKRSSKRTKYSTNTGFAIIVSKESSWRGDITEEEFWESTDLHLHCKEWDELLSSGVWEPEVIVEKLPDFFQFVKQVQGFVAQEMKELKEK